MVDRAERDMANVQCNRLQNLADNYAARVEAAEQLRNEAERERDRLSNSLFMLDPDDHLDPDEAVKSIQKHIDRATEVKELLEAALKNL